MKNAKKEKGEKPQEKWENCEASPHSPQTKVLPCLVFLLAKKMQTERKQKDDYSLTVRR